MLGASFVMYALPILFTLLGVKTSLFWETTPISGLPAGISGTMGPVAPTGGANAVDSSENTKANLTDNIHTTSKNS